MDPKPTKSWSGLDWLVPVLLSLGVPGRAVPLGAQLPGWIRRPEACPKALQLTCKLNIGQKMTFRLLLVWGVIVFC